MARRYTNKSNVWKAIGYTLAVIFALAVLVVAGVSAATAIACLINHVSFVEQFKTWFPFFFKKENVETVVAAAKMLVHGCI